MTLAEALAKLNALEGGADLAAVFQGELSTVRQEAATYRTRAKSSSDRAEALAKHAGIDPNAEDLGSALEAVSKERPQTSDMKALAAQVAALTKTVEAERTGKAQEVARRREMVGKQSALEALGKVNAVSPEDLVGLVASSIVVGEDDQPQWKNSDGTFSPVADGVKNWIGSKPHFVKSNQQGGPGGGSVQGVKVGVPTITRTEYDARAAKDPTLSTSIATGKIAVVDG
jgi:hypothetical protein